MTAPASPSPATAKLHPANYKWSPARASHARRRSSLRWQRRAAPARGFLLPQVAIEGDPTILVVLVSDGLGVEPADNGILDRVGKEMVARGTVVTDEIAFGVLVVRNAKILVV